MEEFGQKQDEQEIQEIQEQNKKVLSGAALTAEDGPLSVQDGPLTEHGNSNNNSSSNDISQDKQDEQFTTKIFALRTTANREDQVMDFITSNINKKKLEVYTVIRPHGMRGYIFIEAATKSDAEQAGFNIPYARGILPHDINYSEIEHMLEQVKKQVNIQKNDIAEIISGPFKREKCKVTRIDKTKEEVVVELLEAAVPIPITVKMDAVKVIRRESKDDEPGIEEEESSEM